MSEFCIGCWGIWLNASVSTDEGRFSSQRSLKPSWSLINVEPSEDSKREQPDAEGPLTVFKVLKNFLELWVSA